MNTATVVTLLSAALNILGIWLTSFEIRKPYRGPQPSISSALLGGGPSPEPSELMAWQITRKNHLKAGWAVLTVGAILGLVAAALAITTQ